MLQASSGSSTLDAVLQRVSEVKTQQDALTAGMAGLQAQVNRANALAEARANDNRIIDLIQAGRQVRSLAPHAPTRAALSGMLSSAFSLEVPPSAGILLNGLVRLQRCV